MKTLQSLLYRFTRPVLFASVFFLPWIETSRLSVFLWIGLGSIILLGGQIPIKLSVMLRQPLFWLFSLYFLFQLVAFFQFPANNYLSVEEKISLVFFPLLFSVLISHSPAYWRIAAWGFICGVFAASLWCLLNAFFVYRHTYNPEVFFYDSLASGLQFNAVYFSCYILAALAYLIPEAVGKPAGIFPKYCGAAALFLYLCLLLLGSKMLIISGSILLLALIFRVTKNGWKRGIAFLLFFFAGMTLLITDNPVKRRYEDIDLHSYTIIFSKKDFSGYPFDGLSLRLVLWRMGIEIIQENRQWVAGLHGGHYHIFLDKKMEMDHLPEANRIGKHGEYHEFNMNNQYVETYIQFGIMGLMVLAGILFYVMRTAIRRHDVILGFIGLLYILFFFTESLLEVQYGILLFSLLLSGECAYARASGVILPGHFTRL